jgi:hypothetical protein
VPSRRGIISQRDVTRILKGANAAGIQMQIIVRGDEVRFVPTSADREVAISLEQWEAQQVDRDIAEARARIFSSGRRGPSSGS